MRSRSIDDSLADHKVPMINHPSKSAHYHSLTGSSLSVGISQTASGNTSFSRQGGGVPLVNSARSPSSGPVKTDDIGRSLRKSYRPTSTSGYSNPTSGYSNPRSVSKSVRNGISLEKNGNFTVVNKQNFGGGFSSNFGKYVQSAGLNYVESVGGPKKTKPREYKRRKIVSNPTSPKDIYPRR